MWTKFLIKVHPLADSLWHNPIFWWALFGVVAILCIWWLLRPSPGKAIAAMGFVAAISAIRGETGGLEKLCWTAILFIFLLLEIRAINNDRAEKQSQFAVTMEQTKSVLTNITGGDSYGVVLPMIGSGRRNDEVLLAIENRGSNILTGVSVTVNPTDRWEHEQMVRAVNNRINLGTLHPRERLILGEKHNPEKWQQRESNVFRAIVFIAAQNFTIVEFLDFKKQAHNDWVFRYKIYKEPLDEKAHSEPCLEAVDWSSDPNAPIRANTADWD